MKHRIFVIIWMAGMGTLGFGLGAYHEQTLSWNADREFFANLGVRPEQLPVFTGEELEDVTSTGLRFEEQQNSGVTFTYRNGPEDQFHLAETLGGGVGVIDFDNDERADLLFIDGGDPVTWPSNRESHVALFREDDSGRFTAATSLSGLNSWTGYGHGCSIADVDNDGFDDVLLTGYQRSALYLNLGDGTFQESITLGRMTGDRWCATGAWSDLDDDGDLDLYVACYADTPRDLPTPVCESGGIRIHCNPHSYHAVSDILLENTGDGNFADRSASSGIAAYREYGLGVMTADLDRNGTTEIFVANDGDRNLLFKQTAAWVYEETALTSGVAFNGRGETMGSMGIACADFNRDGRLDLLTTNFSHESNALFENLGDLTFAEISQGTIIDRTSRSLVGWSAIPFDIDCDAYVDLFVANGHVTHMPSEDWLQLPKLLKGGKSGFEECLDAGSWFEHPQQARGACRVDLNRDGREDLVVTMIDSPAVLLQNATSSAGNRIHLRLIGTSTSRSAEGAIVELETSSQTTVHLMARNTGYLSSNTALLTLGMGSELTAKSIRIVWPNGEIQEVHNIFAGTCITLIEGRQDPIAVFFQP